MPYPPPKPDYDIYFGVLNPPLIADKGLTSPSYDPGLLRADTRYDWSVTVKNGEHATVGPTWTFMTAPANLPPGEPYAPYPADRDSDVPFDQVLAWRCYDPDRDPLTYDVCFGTMNPPFLAARDLDSAWYNPGPLSPGTEYFWAILASDGTDTTLAMARTRRWDPRGGSRRRISPTSTCRWC